MLDSEASVIIIVNNYIINCYKNSPGLVESKKLFLVKEVLFAGLGEKSLILPRVLISPQPEGKGNKVMKTQIEV